MSPIHHPPDELLTDYVTGAAPEAISLFVATHTSVCWDCVEHIAEEEAMAAAMMETLAAPRRDDLLQRVLGRLDEPAPLVAPRVSHPWAPGPLAAYVGTDPRWRRIVPGVEILELPLALGDQPVVLTRIKPGAVVPSHGHAGWELQLVLTGGYTADDGHFGPGDAHCVDDRTVHGFTVDPGEVCISLLVREGRIRARGWKGKLFSWLTGA